jgi:Holliday junction resolvasome RuvABC endonuclease subunit
MTTDPPRIIRALGIDGGTAECGYGLVLLEGGKERFLECGTVETSFKALRALIEATAPDVVGVEGVSIMRQQASSKLLDTKGASTTACNAAESLDVLFYVIGSNVWRRALGIKMTRKKDSRTTDRKIDDALRMRLAAFPAPHKTNNHQRDGVGVALVAGLRLRAKG